MAGVKRFWGRPLRHKWWAVQNWHKGYKFQPIQRCKRCDHTTPFHYEGCGHVAVMPLWRWWYKLTLTVTENVYRLRHRDA